MQNDDATLAAVRAALEQIDQSMEPIDEHDVQSAIRRALPEQVQGDELPHEVRIESSAFAFCPEYDWKDWDDGGWDTYFGPEFVIPTEDGRATISPHVDGLTTEDLDRWKGRAHATKHPILRCRYAALCLDFTRRVNGTGFDYHLAQLFIDSAVQLARERLHRYEIRVFGLLRHAMMWAAKIGDEARKQALADALMEYESAVGELGKPGLWGHAFDMLVGPNRFLTVSEDATAEIVEDLESRLRRCSGEEILNPWTAQSVATQLAEYYAGNGNSEDAHRVMRVYGNALREFGREASPLQVQSWLEMLQSDYMRFGMSVDADEILRELREIGRGTHEDMKTYSHEVTVSAEEMESFVELILGDTLSESFARFVGQFIADRHRAEDQIRDMSRRSPLAYMTGRKILDSEGRTIATVGPLDVDLCGHVIMHLAQIATISRMYAAHALDAIFSKFEIADEGLMEHLRECPVFRDSRSDALLGAFRHYFAGRHAEFILLGIPVFEWGVRRLIEFMGGVVVRKHRSSGFHFLGLEALLRDRLLLQVFGENACLHLRMVMTDSRGINLRNNVCHGLVDATTLGRGEADLLLHAILLLSMVRFEDGEGDGDRAGNEGGHRQ